MKTKNQITSTEILIKKQRDMSQTQSLKSSINLLISMKNVSLIKISLDVRNFRLVIGEM